MMQNNIGNNVGITMNNNGFINGNIMEQGMNLQGYDFNYGVGLTGQNMNQNNSMIINGLNSNQNKGI